MNIFFFQIILQTHFYNNNFFWKKYFKHKYNICFITLEITIFTMIKQIVQKKVIDVKCKPTEILNFNFN